MNGYVLLIDLFVVAGAGLVVPAALGRWWGWWTLVAVSTAFALSFDPGPAAALLALPWSVVALATAGGTTGRVLRGIQRERRWPTMVEVARCAAPGWAVVAGIALLDSCAGWNLSGVGEPITRLTAVHFTYAGVATTALAGAQLRRRTTRLARAAVVLVVAAPPVVAVGFLTSAAAPQVGGAVLMSLGAYLLAAGHLAEGWDRRDGRVGRLLLVSGASVWVPMVLAVAWALAQHTGGAALSIPDLVRIHGGLNAVGFVGCGLAARWLDGHQVVVIASDRPAGAPLATRVGR